MAEDNADKTPMSPGDYLANNLRKLLDTQQYCDITLTFGSTQSPTLECHRVVLAAASSYFRDNFLCRSGTDDDNGDITNIININDVNYDVMKEMVKFMYNGECKVTDDNVVDLLHYGFKWNVYGLDLYCLNFAIEDGRLVQVFNVLTQHDAQDMNSDLGKRIRETVASTEHRSSMMKLSMKSLLLLLQEDELRCTEEALFDLVNDWIDSQVRDVSGDDVTKLFAHLRLHHMSRDYLCDVVLRCDKIRDTPEFSKALDCLKGSSTSESLVLLPKRIWASGFDSGIHDKATDNSQQLYSLLDKQVFKYLSTEKTWKRVASLADCKTLEICPVLDRSPAALLTLQNNNTMTSKVSLFDISSNTFMTLPNLPDLVASVYSCQLKERLHVATRRVFRNNEWKPEVRVYVVSTAPNESEKKWECVKYLREMYGADPSKCLFVSNADTFSTVYATKTYKDNEDAQSYSFLMISNNNVNFSVKVSLPQYGNPLNFMSVTSINGTIAVFTEDRVWMLVDKKFLEKSYKDVGPLNVFTHNDTVFAYKYCKSNMIKIFDRVHCNWFNSDIPCPDQCNFKTIFFSVSSSSS